MEKKVESLFQESNDKIKIENKTCHDEFKSAHQNKIDFVKKYGVCLDLPTMTVKDTIFLREKDEDLKKEEVRFCF